MNNDDLESQIIVNADEYKPSAMGNRVHKSLARTKILRGGYGSGKTRCACEHINNLALRYPGSLHFIGRRDLTSLKTTTQREFLEYVVSPETIDRFHKNDNILFYKNGSQVLFRETKEPAKVKSLELTSYFLDEADENETDEIWEKLDARLRQKIRVNGKRIQPLYCGLIVLNPTGEDHWIPTLAKRTDIDVEDFKFTTYDNKENLPTDYIPNLLKKLAPWEIDRLVYGEWGKEIRGKPVIHGFTEEKNVRPLKIRDDLPLLRGWDFGFHHPCVSFTQIDPKLGRFYKHRELLGHKEYLKDFVPRVKDITLSLVSDGYPIMDYGDPHGADERDTSESSIEYLRLHHQIYVSYRRSRIKTGLDEIQDKMIRDGLIHNTEGEKKERLFLLDPSCKISIAAYQYGYHRDDKGMPVKDGYYDHPVDTDRYLIVNNMTHMLSGRLKRKPYRPKSKITGY